MNHVAGRLGGLQAHPVQSPEAYRPLADQFRVFSEGQGIMSDTNTATTDQQDVQAVQEWSSRLDP